MRQLVKESLMPLHKFKPYLACTGKNVAADNGRENRRSTIGCCNAEGCLFFRWIEVRTAEQTIDPWKHHLQLLQKPHTPRRKLIASDSSHEKIVMKGIAQSLQGAAYRGLAEKKTLCCAGDVALLREDGKDYQQVQIGLS